MGWFSMAAAEEDAAPPDEGSFASINGCGKQSGHPMSYAVSAALMPSNTAGMPIRPNPPQANADTAALPSPTPSARP